MSCDRVRKDLKAFADKELGLFRRLRIGLHVAACGACKAELAETRRLSEELAASPRPSSPPAVRQWVRHAAVSRQLNEAAETHPAPGQEQSAWGGRTAPRPGEGRWAGGYAAAVARIALPAAIGVGVVAFLLWRQSPAAALDRIRAAAGNVTSAHMVYLRYREGGKPLRSTMWYADGKFRMEEDPGDIISVFDGRRLHSYHVRENVFFKNISDQPSGEGFRGFTVEAMLETDRGAEVSLDRNSTWEGHPALRVTIEHPNMGERCILWADPDTHLPLAAEVYRRSGSQWILGGASELMEYNVPVPEGIFTLDIPDDARVIDKETIGRKWQARYEKGLGSQTVADVTVTLRDFQVCSEGDVFAIWSPGERWSGEIRLNDDVGTEYLPASVTSGSAGWPFQPWPDGGAWFTPLAPPVKHPSRFVLEALVRRRGKPTAEASFVVSDPFRSPLVAPLYPSFIEDPDRSRHFIYPGEGTIIIEGAEARVRYWKKAGNLQAALDEYENMIAKVDRLSRNPSVISPRVWRDVGDLREQMGQPDQARNAYQRGITSAPAYRDADSWTRDLREALRRLER